MPYCLLLGGKIKIYDLVKYFNLYHRIKLSALLSYLISFLFRSENIPSVLEHVHRDFFRKTDISFFRKKVETLNILILDDEMDTYLKKFREGGIDIIDTSFLSLIPNLRVITYS